jgi:hypothetical protein
MKVKTMTQLTLEDGTLCKTLNIDGHIVTMRKGKKSGGGWHRWQARVFPTFGGDFGIMTFSTKYSEALDRVKSQLPYRLSELLTADDVLGHEAANDPDHEASAQIPLFRKAS